MPTALTICMCTAICCFFPGTKPDCRYSTSPTRPTRSMSAHSTPFLARPTNFSGNWGVDLSLGLDRVLLSDRQRGLIVVDAPACLLRATTTRTWSSMTTTTRCGEAHSAPRAAACTTAAFADGNYNGTVDAADYVIWRKHLGQTGPTGPAVPRSSGRSAVPEPAAILLFAVGIGLLFPRCRCPELTAARHAVLPIVQNGLS